MSVLSRYNIKRHSSFTKLIWVAIFAAVTVSQIHTAMASTTNNDPECDILTDGVAPEEQNTEDEQGGCQKQEEILEKELKKSFKRSFKRAVRSKSDAPILGKIKATCDEIFRDIDQLKGLGHPGKLIVFGTNALPVLMSSDGAGVCMAVSEVGKGRAVFMSSQGFSRGLMQGKGKEQLAILHENIMRWVSGCRGKCDDIKIRNLMRVNLAEINKEKVVVFSRNFNYLLERQEELLGFLKDGGGLIIAFNTAQWYNKHPRKVTKDGNKFLKRIGIALTGDRLFIPKPKYDIKFEEQTYQDLLGLHLSHWLDACCETDVENMREMAREMRKVLPGIPPYALTTHGEKLSTLFNKCNDHVKDHIPRPRRSVRNVSHLGAIDMLSVLTHCGVGYAKVPNVQNFPGDFPKPPEMECVDIEITSRGVSECHATGYYLPPGKPLKIEVLNEKVPNQWSVRIGAHSDKLYGKEVLKRWPDIVVKQVISEKEMEIPSAFGGNIYIRCPDSKKDTTSLKLKLYDVVETPLFDLSDPVSVSMWAQKRRKAPGLWADMCGKHIKITVPSKSIHNMKDPSTVMETWDRVMLAHLDLRGQDPESHRKQWIVYDTQIGAGAMHSGYPIMGHIGIATDPKSPSFILNNERFTNGGFWGPYHELGHNMQRNWWTFEGTREVTCNIFTLHAYDVVGGIPVWEHDKFNSPQKLTAVRNYLKKGAHFEEWKKSSLVALVFYAQLAHHFGWDTYKAVFREYEKLPVKEQPKKNQEKIDQWMYRFSKQAGVSIAPIMEFWGLPLSDAAKKEVEGLKPFLSDDRMTQQDDDRAETILEKYPGIIRSLEK